MSKMPVQKPGRSEQDVGTPSWLVQAVENVWGKFEVDLAASDQNHVCPYYIKKEEDSLGLDWSGFTGNLWLNPPYSKIEPWVRKASQYNGRHILVMLVPASVGSNWWRDYVHEQCHVEFLPRFRFVGHKQVYPKDCALLVYWPSRNSTGYDTWNLREPKST